MDKQITLDYITKKYNLDLSQKSPFFIPNTDRNRLAKLFAELDFKEGAEIGTAEGSYAMRLLVKNPRLKLHCIDSWVKYKGYNDDAKDTFSESEGMAKETLKGFNCNFIKKFSMDAVKDFEDESLDFVYIDANHAYEFVLEDIIGWSKKVRVGGIVSGHDYDYEGVRKALEEYRKDYFVLGRKERLPGERRESSRSWFFIKENYGEE